ncbi:unnamed protein product, partial [marine sediment metagenome]
GYYLGLYLGCSTPIVTILTSNNVSPIPEDANVWSSLIGAQCSQVSAVM